MREDCKYFQRRAYPSGDEARFCALDLAPEAPWRCPADCPRYSRRVGERHQAGTPGEAGPPAEPELHPDAARILGSAEDIITAIAPELAREDARRRQEEERRRQPSRWQRWRTRSTKWRR